MLWLENYEVKLPELGPKYGIPDSDINLALVAIKGMKTSLLMMRDIRAWLEQWLKVKEDQQYDKAKDQSVMVTWPETPKWTTFPEPIKVNAWAPVLNTTKSFLAKSNLSEQDKTALWLNKYVPEVKRDRAAKYLEYPSVSLVEENGFVVIRTVRGARYRGLLAKFVIDRNQEGVYEDLTTSVDKEVRVSVEFVEGIELMTWSFRAIYMKNGQEIDQWCPPQAIVLRRTGPVMGTAKKSAALVAGMTNGVLQN